MKQVGVRRGCEIEKAEAITHLDDYRSAKGSWSQDRLGS